MTEFRYKTFISYSHRDEAWAKWLHKSLETYRLPKAIAEAIGSQGQASRRLGSVFRDRDEFASAANLGEEVQQALQDSETLVVICSPDAAQSKWVNEEIRAFRSLGRAERILCMIVAGDPQAKSLEESCFPPALLEAGVGETKEPLAADIRKWADGKTLAKLKLISGILGVRLDELRRREQKRKARKQLLTGVLAVVALLMLGLTIKTKLQERARLAYSEALISEIVAISDDLNNVVDLDMLRTIGERLKGYLETLDASELTPESNKQIALVLRQLGEVSRRQGNPEEAFSALTESRDIFARLVEDNPGNQNFLFELGNAEFYVGNTLMAQGRLEPAETAFDNYAEIARQLHELDPANPDWMMERSYSHTNLAGFQIRSGRGEMQQALGHMNEAIALVEQALKARPGDSSYKAHYATTLAWEADTQLLVCNLDEALQSRLKAANLAQSNRELDTRDNNLKKQHAYRLTGLANIQVLKGQTEAALENLEQARILLQGLTDFDPENFEYQWGLLRVQAIIFDLYHQAEKNERALEIGVSLDRPMREALGEDWSEQPVQHSQYALFLLDYADLLWETANPILAREMARQAITELKSIYSANPDDAVTYHRLVKARFLWWQHESADLAETDAGLALLINNPSSQPASCAAAVSAVQTAVIEDDRQKAQERVNYLLGKGYAEPSFIRSCQSFRLCRQDS